MTSLKSNLNRFSLLLLFVGVVSASAIPVAPFSSWTDLISSSPDIVVVKCLPEEKDLPSNVVPPFSNVIVNNVELALALKGSRIPNLSTVHSLVKMHSSEYYMIFGVYKETFLQAVEDYRIVPLGNVFHPSDFKDRSCDEQIRLIFQWRVDMLTNEIAQAQEQRKRLEDALKN